ncbi:MULTISPECIES: hypothetical protein [Haloferax]|uniref:Small CPxCG-related zinc finger protein n=1 Tax=Haloferax sp. CBA1149 TaxID=2650753 RepID=A0A643JX26_9EURY|nr:MULTISPECIES: hypothetical protein [Haloferax]KAB1185824.1 hypothetical protein Hfx1149_14490 [Haloferax sp. CBA1149]KAB1186891.1 hypothetical protein Hfx1149_02150 [Haloferax sp. CBA1149]KAB1187798.1 hypothetical protein Hfx1149_07025 [Haloferax sp. CBA1149]
MLLSLEAQPRECEYCGSHVTHNFCRVYGDSEDRVHRCRECDTAVRIQRGSAAGRDVPTPDPQESPGRHGGQPERWSK